MDTPSTPSVTVHLPALLAQSAGGRRRFQGSGETLGEVLERVFMEAPGLRVHILDESGHIRRHVLCYIGDTDSRWREGLATEVPRGTDVTIVQAVSGG